MTAPTQMSAGILQVLIFSVAVSFSTHPPGILHTQTFPRVTFSSNSPVRNVGTTDTNCQPTYEDLNWRNNSNADSQLRESLFWKKAREHSIASCIHGACLFPNNAGRGNQPNHYARSRNYGLERTWRSTAERTNLCMVQIQRH